MDRVLARLNRLEEKVDNLLVEVDKLAAQELKLFITNDKQLTKQSFIPIVKSLAKKKKSDKYNAKLAMKEFMPLINSGVVKLTKNSDVVFDKSTRELVAKMFVEDFEDAWELRKFDFME